MMLAIQVLDTVKLFINGMVMDSSTGKTQGECYRITIKRNNPRKSLYSIGNGEIVEFNAMERVKGAELLI